VESHSREGEEYQSGSLFFFPWFILAPASSLASAPVPIDVDNIHQTILSGFREGVMCVSDVQTIFIKDAMDQVLPRPYYTFIRKSHNRCFASASID
jgi:hypothetical protein